MTFTKEEREKLIANGKAIEKFIREEIMPHLREPVMIEFGDEVRRGRYQESREREYTLTVANGRLGASYGGLSLYFGDMPIYFKGMTGCIDIYEDKSWGHEFLNALSLNWRHGEFIRSCLITAVEKQNEQHKKVFETFEV